MSRYGGYTEPLEAMVELLKETRRTNELLEQLINGKLTSDSVELVADKPDKPRGRGKVKGDTHANE